MMTATVREDALIFSPGEPIRLSNTALKNYMTCPRLFYYRQALFLPAPGQAAMASGLLIHRLLEWFNTTYQPDNPAWGYQASRLQQQIERVFSPLESMTGDDERRAHLKNCGLQDTDWDLIGPMGPLGWISFAEDAAAAVRDMADQGYFSRFGQPRQIHAEVKFNMPVLAWSMPDHPVILSGSLDALIQDEAGGWHIVDYKRYGNGTFNTKPETCRAQFLTRLLTPLAEGAGFEERLHPVYPVDYQLPLYCLAFEQSESLASYRAAGPLTTLGIQLVRPPVAGKTAQGSMDLTVDAETMVAAMPALMAEIRDRLVLPIGEATHFSALPGLGCARCAYAGICEGPAMAGLDDGNDAEVAA